MENTTRPIHLLNGKLLGFVIENQIHSRDGDYIGRVEENNTCWNVNGYFRGKLTEINGAYYILKEQFVLDPINRGIANQKITVRIPKIQININSITSPERKVDGFQLTTIIK